MEFDKLAFQYVEMALSSLLASKPVPSVGPGVVARISNMQFGSPQKHQIASAMGLRDGQPALCLTAENSDGECQVNCGRGKTFWIKRSSLLAKDQKDDASDCGGGDCGGGSGCCKAQSGCADGGRSADTCAASSKEDLAQALEASAERVDQACLAVKDGAALPAEALERLRLQMVAAKRDFKAVLAEAKQSIEGDARLAKLNLSGPCTNELCLCAVCECGTTCRCNVADVKDSDTCEKCVEFRAEKKKANGCNS